MLRIERELAELREQTRQPDPHWVNLIEQAFLDGQIDSDNAALAYLFLAYQEQLFQVIAADKSH